MIGKFNTVKLKLEFTAADHGPGRERNNINELIRKRLVWLRLFKRSSLLLELNPSSSWLTGVCHFSLLSALKYISRMPPPHRKPKFTEPRCQSKPRTFSYCLFNFALFQFTDFDFISDSKRWSCNACSPSPALAGRNSMTAQVALNHEKTGSHKEAVQARESWNPPQDVDAWINGTDGLFGGREIERMQHVDQLKDFIPFWRKTIEAADHGETLRFEDFLNALQKNEKEEVAWDVPMPDWALEPLEPVDAEQRSSETGNVQLSVTENDVDRDAFNFVEKVAKMESVNSERKKRLHSFYKVSIF